MRAFALFLLLFCFFSASSYGVSTSPSCAASIASTVPSYAARACAAPPTHDRSYLRKYTPSNRRENQNQRTTLNLRAFKEAVKAFIIQFSTLEEDAKSYRSKSPVGDKSYWEQTVDEQAKLKREKICGDFIGKWRTHTNKLVDFLFKNEDSGAFIFIRDDQQLPKNLQETLKNQFTLDKTYLLTSPLNGPKFKLLTYTKDDLFFSIEVY